MNVRDFDEMKEGVRRASKAASQKKQRVLERLQGKNR
jgi:hydrogenase maturation factor HypE